MRMLSLTLTLKGLVERIHKTIFCQSIERNDYGDSMAESGNLLTPPSSCWRVSLSEQTHCPCRTWNLGTIPSGS
jgi:hypothetical protein